MTRPLTSSEITVIRAAIEALDISADGCGHKPRQPSTCPYCDDNHIAGRARKALNAAIKETS